MAIERGMGDCSETGDALEIVLSLGCRFGYVSQFPLQIGDFLIQRTKRFLNTVKFPLST